MVYTYPQTPNRAHKIETTVKPLKELSSIRFYLLQKPTICKLFKHGHLFLLAPLSFPLLYVSISVSDQCVSTDALADILDVNMVPPQRFHSGPLCPVVASAVHPHGLCSTIGLLSVFAATL